LHFAPAKAIFVTRQTNKSKIVIDVIEKRRELGKDVIVAYLSLVGKPANRRGFVMKSDDAFECDGTLLKYDEPKGLMYVTNYEPDVDDSQGDYASADTIQSWAHDFLKSARVSNVDYEHNYRPGYGSVVESFIKRGDDPMFAGVKNGAWCAVIQLTDAGKAIAKSVGGISFAGTRMREKSEEGLLLGCRPGTMRGTNPNFAMRIRN
jgi:hypothetical protein